MMRLQSNEQHSEQTSYGSGEDGKQMNVSWWTVYCKGSGKKATTVPWAKFSNRIDACAYVAKLEDGNPTWTVWIKEPIERSRRSKPTRNERILESGYEAYAREEGHYDQGEY